MTDLILRTLIVNVNWWEGQTQAGVSIMFSWVVLLKILAEIYLL